MINLSFIFKYFECQFKTYVFYFQLVYIDVFQCIYFKSEPIEE